MHSLASITIDAGVLAVPSVDSAKDDAFQYVDTLLDWSKLLDEPWLAIYMSEQASENLINEKLYPMRDDLTNLFVKHGIVEYSVNDITKVIAKLLTLTASFETCYHLKEVLFENLETVPDVIHLTKYDKLQSGLSRSITLIAILRKYCKLALGGHTLVLREAPKQTVQVKAKIHEIEHSRDDLDALPPPPVFFEGEVLVSDDFSGLIECLDESAILIGASEDREIELAIRIAMFKGAIVQGEIPDWSKVLLPKFGSNFRKSCQQVCADTGDSLPPKILRSIVETLNGQNLSAVHALRGGSGKSGPQRTRGSDNAKAQRRDIDKEFHLHYWECGNGTVELAAVVYHNCFKIPE